MNNRLIALLGFLLALLLAFVAGGPWLAMNGIRNVIASGDYGKLSYFVDFDKLRASVAPQMRARITSGVSERIGGGRTGEVAADVAAAISGPAIDAMVSPLGVATLLRGSALANKLSGQVGPDGRMRAADPLKDARTQFNSASRFTATVDNAEGNPVVFVFERSGIRWKLTGLELPG